MMKNKKVIYTIEEQGEKRAFYCEPAYYEALAH
jgi:hypothetical protein